MGAIIALHSLLFLSADSARRDLIYTLCRVLLALGKFGDFSFQVFSVFYFGDFTLAFSNSTVTNSLVTALLKSIDIIFIISG